MDRKKELIEKLFNDQCTGKELLELLQLTGDEPEENHNALMQKLWEQLEAQSIPERDVSSRIVERAMAKVRVEIEAEGKQIARRQMKRRYFLTAVSAAAVLLLCIGALSRYWLQPAPRVVVKTAFGEQKDIVLPDGSVVHLNANSSLTYQEEWKEQADRQVWLQGEAFFTVRKKPATGQKFKVFTNDLTVEVLGTAFNVNTHQAQTKVFLEEGSVKLELKEEQDPIFLQPGEQAVYSVLTKIRKKKYIEIEHPASWKDGVHVFENRPLWRILERIEEIYGVKIEVGNKERLERTFKIAIPVNDFATALQVLKEVTKLDIQEKEGRVIIF